MRFFKRNTTDTAAIPEDLQPYYKSQGTGLSRWIGPVLRAFVLLAVLVLVVWGGIRLVHAVTGDDEADKTTTAQNSTQKSDDNNTSSNNKPDNSAATTPTPTATPTPQPTPTPTPTPAPTPTPKATPTPKSATVTPTPAATPTPAPVATTPTPAPQLANSGPGEAFVLFFVVTATATLLHHFYQSRRFGN